MIEISKEFEAFFYLLILLTFSIVTLMGTYHYFQKVIKKNPHSRVVFQLVLTAEVFFFLFIIIVFLPIRDSLKGQVLSFFGILVSGTLALSSTTLLGNILAGVMLRSVGSLKMGDFIKVENYFGRISEKGLFHIEIQTEDRNLVTIFNIQLITKPIKVVQSSGTVITSEVSLGYDVSSEFVKKLLIEAAENSGLESPFVYTIELGDFSILYRVSGLLSEVKYLISADYNLNDEILKVLHKNSIEIVSPNFMNTRTINDQIFIPKGDIEVKDEKADEAPEDKIFEKADLAEMLEGNIGVLKEIADEIERIEEEVSLTSEEEKKIKIKERLIALKEKEIKVKNDIEKEKEILNSSE